MMSQNTFTRTVIFILLVLGTTSFLSAQGSTNDDLLSLKSTDFPQNWDGTLAYLDYSDNKTMVKLPCRLTISSKGDKLITKVVFEEKKNGKPIIHKSSYKISADRKYLQTQKKWEITDIVEDGTKSIITAISKGKDNNQDAEIRLTLTVSHTHFSQKKEVKYANSKDYILRNEYTFGE